MATQADELSCIYDAVHYWVVRATLRRVGVAKGLTLGFRVCAGADLVLNYAVVLSESQGRARFCAGEDGVVLLKKT
jgi:hypothetical protein